MLGAKESGHQIEKIFLRDREVNFCLARDACRANEGNCIQQDAMAEIQNKMVAADVIVMATPVYFYTMSRQMKTLIDRTYPRYLE